MDSKPPTKHQVRKWHERIAWYVDQFGPVVLEAGENPGTVQHHHVKGRTYIHNKVHIGEWFVIPLPWVLHDIHSNHPANVTFYPEMFVEQYGRQCEMWVEMVGEIRKQFGQLPFGNDVIEAVIATGE